MGRAIRKSIARDRANLSFFIVVIFFAVFSAIVLTEIFLIDDRARSNSLKTGRGPTSRLHRDYDENGPQGAEDYLVYHAGQVPVPVADDAAGTAHLSLRLHRPQVPALGPSTAPNAPLPPLGNLTASEGSWQTVPGTRFKFFVFSAYYERRGQRAIRVIAATKTRGPERVWCRLWYSGNSSGVPVSVPGKVRVIRENWNLKYSACFVLCPLRANQSTPSSVSVVARLRIPPNNLLLVHQPPTATNTTDRLAVCIKPLHYNYSQALKLIEFIELNSLLGVSNFFFYNHTCSDQVSCVLEDYRSRGRVSVLPWKLDIPSQTEIRTEGLFAALNDCLYRTMYRFSHIALIDLDEFIVPRHNDTLQQFIDWMGKRINTRNTGSYSFQNAFFYLQWGDDYGGGVPRNALETHLMTLHKTRRRAKLHPHKQRSKYICRPERVIEVGNHFVWEFIPGHGTVNVPGDAAIMHHYRDSDMDYKTWSRFEAVPLSNGIITRRTGLGYLKPPEEIMAYYRKHFGIYWFNELPKTDNVYSPGSNFYGCTLAPGIPLIPNLCRRPLRSPDGGYDYTTTRTSVYTTYGEDDREEAWSERNNNINKPLDNGHSGYNNTRLTSLNLPLPRRRIEFNDSGLDSDSEYEVYDNHTGHANTQSRSDNHVTWFSWVVTVVTTIVTTVVTTVTETMQLRGEKRYDHVDTRVPLNRRVAVSWYQYPVLWMYQAALAVQRADMWILWKANSFLQVDKWGTSKQRRKWALILLLIPIIIWAAYKLYEWLSDETSPLDSAAVWVAAPFSFVWDYLTVPAWVSSGYGWFDGSWVSYPWVALAGWWESADQAAAEETMEEEGWEVDWSGATAWAAWPFNSLSVVLASLGTYLGSAVSTFGEGVVTTYTSVLSLLSAVLFWIVHFVIAIPAVATSAFAVLVSPLTSLSWPASQPVPDSTPSAPPYESQFYQPPPPPATGANWDHMLGDQQLLAALVRRLLATPEFHHALSERQSSDRDGETAFTAALERINTEVNKLKTELSDKITLEGSSVESKMELFKQQIEDLQMALNAHKALLSEQAALGSKLEEKLTLEQLKAIEDQVTINMKDQVLLEVMTVREEILAQVTNLQTNQRVVTGTSADGSSDPITPSADLEAFVNATVERLLAIYDADKIAKADYALASSGGSVLSVRCTEAFSLKNAQYHLWGYPLWSKSGNDPRVALEPGIVPGQCWAFSGNQGHLIIELSENITVTGVTLEHLPRTLSPSGTIDTAPRDFRVLGLESEQDDMPILLGRFTYLDNGKSLQYFDALEVDHSFKIVELVIESNHGNLEYTCLYRFRVHGRPASTP